MSRSRYIVVVIVAVLASAATFAILTGSGSGWRAAFAIRDEVSPLLDSSVTNLRELRSLNPAEEPRYRAEFDRVMQLRRRLEILEQSREALLQRSAAVSVTSFVLALLGGLALIAVAGRRERARFDEFRLMLEAAVAEQRVVANTLRGSDTLARAGLLVEQLSLERERTRERLADLSALESWQDHVRRVSHELRTPLAAAMLRYRRAMAESPDKEVLQDLGEDLVHLEQMTTAMRDFAIIGSPQPRELDLLHFLEEFTRLFAESWSSLEIRLSGEAVQVLADAELTRRLLTNLIDNAAAAGASRVTISVSSSASSAFCTVSDDGAGVPVEIRDALFEPYVTSRGTRGGTGLGLAISRKIALDQKGDLRLVFSKPGHTEFEIVLPRA